MSISNSSTGSGGVSLKLLALGFIAGVIAVPLGHQIAAFILYLTIPGRAMPWSFQTSNHVFGVPQLINQSFWGGVWGLVFVYVERWFPRGVWYWVAATAFGAIALVLVGWFVVGPIKGQPFTMARVNWIGFFLNGFWGLACAFFYDLLRKRA